MAGSQSRRVRERDKAPEEDLAHHIGLMSESACLWGRRLTEDDIGKLVAADGDCIKAGIPCDKHKVCGECGGTGLDHPESHKYRNTDDDSCPMCKGSGRVER